jgi:hypothetical protein
MRWLTIWRKPAGGNRRAERGNKNHAVSFWKPDDDPTMIHVQSCGTKPYSVRVTKGGLHVEENSNRAGCYCSDCAIAGQRFGAWRIWRFPRWRICGRWFPRWGVWGRWLARRRLGRWRLARRWLGLAWTGPRSFGRGCRLRYCQRHVGPRLGLGRSGLGGRCLGRMHALASGLDRLGLAPCTRERLLVRDA